jgi:hypothetical protein
MNKVAKNMSTQMNKAIVRRYMSEMMKQLAATKSPRKASIY